MESVLLSMGYRRIEDPELDAWAKPVGYGCFTYNAKTHDLSYRFFCVDGTPMLWNTETVQSNDKEEFLHLLTAFENWNLKVVSENPTKKTFAFLTKEQIFSTLT